MTILISTLGQMAFLALLIATGYLLVRLAAVPSSTAKALSKLENNLFVPALMLGTFMQSFTRESFRTSGLFFLAGSIAMLLSLLIATLLSRLFTKDAYLQRIYCYCLGFPNSGFMGNAVMLAMFPGIFMEYLIFTLPQQILTHAFGVPCLLMPKEAQDTTQTRWQRFKLRARPFFNPMLIAMLVGMLIGILNLPLPGFFKSTVNTLGDCMSPVAMLLTGMIIADIDLGGALSNLKSYLISAIRLLAIPLATLMALLLIDMPQSLRICIVCALSMPLGLNSIVIPRAFDLDTTDAAGMILISHLFSCATIPLVFAIFNLI